MKPKDRTLTGRQKVRNQKVHLLNFSGLSTTERCEYRLFSDPPKIDNTISKHNNISNYLS